MSWEKVAKLSDFPRTNLMSVKPKGQEICLIKSGDTVYAINDTCTHEECPLHEGSIEDNEKILMCSCHGARYEFATGKVQEDTPWATEDLKTYKTKVESGEIFVDV